MGTRERHNLRVLGDGATTMVFAHGFGCDQNMWHLLVPAFAERYRVVLYDLMGSGRSDLRRYDRDRHGTLRGHAEDLLTILDEVGGGPAVFVGHSVSAMIGLLAGIQRPEAFASQIMVGPSPCYIDDGDYVGGFSRADIDSLLETLEGNYLGWASAIAPTIMGAPDRPELSKELENSFCRTDPEIAKHFARVTFLSDNRGDVPRLTTRALVLQCSDDVIAPRPVGDWLVRHLPNGTLRVVENIGHCPHLSAPSALAEAMQDFLGR
jgi:sigma-B regulation protein RsbQ